MIVPIISDLDKFEFRYFTDTSQFIAFLKIEIFVSQISELRKLIFRFATKFITNI